MTLVCVVSVKVVNSSENVVLIDDLAAGSHYHVHIESISLSGIAGSKSESFETLPLRGDWQTPLIAVAVAFLVVFAVAFVALFYR